MKSSARSTAQSMFQLSAVSIALALAGCGGGDTVDSLGPKPCIGTNCNPDNPNNPNNPVEKDFFLQQISVKPNVIKLDDTSKEFEVVVKVVETATGGAVLGKEVTLSVADAANNGVTINGGSTQTSDSSGNATYTLILNPDLVNDKAKLLQDGISLKASAKTADNKVKEQELVVGVSTIGGGTVTSDIIFSTDIDSSSVAGSNINPYGDTVSIKVKAVNPNGSAAADVTVVLGTGIIDGVSIIDGNTKQTDVNGVTEFTVNVSSNLTAVQRAQLVQMGIAYTIKLIEANGEEVSQTGTWTVANPDSDYSLEVVGSSIPINAYGETQSLQIVATPKSSNVPSDIAGAQASILLNNAPNGVSLDKTTVVLDSTGKATLNLIVADNLDEAARQALVASGISYTITLTEPSQAISTTTATNSVYIPEAKYQLIFDSSDKKVLSSSGGMAEITFVVNDENGGAVVGQTVVASLPSAVKQKGLITLDNAAAQETDTNGKVTYIARIPSGLSDAQKLELEQIGQFALGVSIKEDSGAVSSSASQIISVTSAIGQSDIELTTGASVDKVNVLGDTFTINVNAVQKDGGAAINEEVKLIIKDPIGISISGGNTLTTNSNGIAAFTVVLSNSLSQANRDALVASGIKYTGILTESDGTRSQVDGSVDVAKPESLIKVVDVIADPISAIGGNTMVTVQLANKDDTAVRDKEVTLKLTNTAKSYGVTVATVTQKTGIEGKAIFSVNLPDGLSKVQRDELVASGIAYQVSYEENNLTYETALQTIDVKPVQVALNILNANNASEYIFSNTGDLVTIKSQLINNGTDRPLANQAVAIKLDSPDLAKLLTVNGQIGTSNIEASTDANGIVSFDVIIPNDLTQQQRSALDNVTIQATLTESVTNTAKTVDLQIKSSLSQVTLVASTLSTLNLNGGETQVQVVAQDSAGNVVAGQDIAFALPSEIAQNGLVISSSPTQKTNNSGIAYFTVSAPNDLSAAQKNAIGGSFPVGVSTIDTNGNSETQTISINTVQPTSTDESLTLGANKTVNTDGDTFKVYARITDANNNGVANTVVRLKVDEPLKTGVTISGSNEVTTSIDGIATFNLTLEPGATVNQELLRQGIRVTASGTSSEGVALSQDYLINVDTTTIDSYVLMSSNEKAKLNTGGDQTDLTFRVVDNQGGVLQGVPLQLSVTNPLQSGAALTTTSVVTTDAQGLVQAGVVLGANSINSRLNHEIVVTGKVVTPEYDQNGNVTLTTRAQEQVVLQATGTSFEIQSTVTSLRSDEEATVTTVLKDATGNAISSADVELIDIDGNRIASSSIVQTDTDGIATFTLKESDLTFDANGNLRIFAKAIGEQGLVTQTSSNSIYLVQISQAGISFSDVAKVYDANTTQMLNIQIRSNNLQALIGKQVEVTTTLGTFLNNDVITTKTIDASMINGDVILVPVELTSTAAGTAVLTAEVLGQTNNAGEAFKTTIDTRFRATDPAKLLLQSTRSVITPGGSTEIIAIVKDTKDVPVEGVTIVFSRMDDSSAGRLSAATAVTDERGEAKVTYKANASSPIRGVNIRARLLNDPNGIGDKLTQITVSQDAVYTTLAFSDKIQKSNDNIYYFVAGSIAVMDGSGRPVANKEVSLKSYATEYSQGLYCMVTTSFNYQAMPTYDNNGNLVTPDPISIESTTVEGFSSGWLPTEDLQYNYILDKNENDGQLNYVVDAAGNIILDASGAPIQVDDNRNNKLEAINPVTILDGTLSDDAYTFVTDDEGKVDFRIRYPKNYSNWVKVRFDATTQLNGSENLQSFNIQLPAAIDDFSTSSNGIITPYINNASPFGIGTQVCIENLSISANTINQTSSVSGRVSDLEQNLPLSLYIDGLDSTAFPPYGQVVITGEEVSRLEPTFNFGFQNAFTPGANVTVIVGTSRLTKTFNVDR